MFDSDGNQSRNGIPITQRGIVWTAIVDNRIRGVMDKPQPDYYKVGPNAEIDNSWGKLLMIRLVTRIALSRTLLTLASTSTEANNQLLPIVNLFVKITFFYFRFWYSLDFLVSWPPHLIGLSVHPVSKREFFKIKHVHLWTFWISRKKNLETSE